MKMTFSQDMLASAAKICQKNVIKGGRPWRRQAHQATVFGSISKEGGAGDGNPHNY